MFIVPSLGSFVSPGIGGVHTTPTAAERPRTCPPIPARLHSSPWCIQKPDVVQFWQSTLITTSGTLIPECNDLSQFREDTGEPSMPVREFNLVACPLVQSNWKTLPDPYSNSGRRESSAHQASRHCLLTVVSRHCLLTVVSRHCLLTVVSRHCLLTVA